MMQIKICGLTKPEEATFLNKNQVDYAGMVLFYEKSKRNITIEQAQGIMKTLDKKINSVAVVVSPSIEQIKMIEQSGFDFIQIHGTMPKEILEESEEMQIPILKAFNITDMNNYEMYHQCKAVAGYVFDAQEPGSGRTFDWRLVRDIPRDEKLLILAGGLNPDNVCEAIRYLKPDGVDVSSGVENDTGEGKDRNKIDRFVRNVRAAEKN